MLEIVTSSFKIITLDLNIWPPRNINLKLIRPSPSKRGPFTNLSVVQGRISKINVERRRQKKNPGNLVKILTVHLHMHVSD